MHCGCQKIMSVIMNYRFLTTETSLKALYIFWFFTTSSVKLFVVTVQIFVYKSLFAIVFFGKRKKKKTSRNLSHFENETTFRKIITF